MITKYRTASCINEALIDNIGLHPFIVSSLFPTCIGDYDRPCGSYLPYYRQPTTNLVSITQFAEQLSLAETQIANEIGTFIMPQNVCNESIEITHDYRVEYRKNGPKMPVTNQTFKTKYSCVIDYGQYEINTVGTGAVTYLDIDGDGFTELARIDFDNSAGHDPNDLKLFFQDFYEYDNEICPVRYTETNGNTLSLFVDSWNMVDPTIYTRRNFTTTQTTPDACSEENFVSTVDVGKLQKNTCNPDGYLYYTKPNCGADCEEYSVPFCAVPVKDKSSGYFKISLGNIDEETGCFVDGINCDIGYGSELTRVEINYYAGCQTCESNITTNIATCNLLKRAALLMAVSRVSILNCCENCGGYGDQWNNYQKDVNYFSRTGEDRFNYPNSLRSNPFGSRLGEIEAWRIIKNLNHDFC